MNVKCDIQSLGSYVPDSILTNSDMARLVDTSDQWIVERTGIHQRRKLDREENASDMGLKAANTAFCRSGLTPDQLTHVITATCTPDYLAPAVSCVIAGKLHCGPVMAFDIGAACAGFIYGLYICKTILSGNPQSKILFVCTEALTRRINWEDRTTCVLFGDAATACLIEAGNGSGLCRVVDVLCQSDGSQKDLIVVGGGTRCLYKAGQEVDESFFISMQGPDTYKHAVRQMVNVCDQMLKKNNLDINDIDLFVPHQANMRIIEAVGARLKIDSSRVFTNVGYYGNTSAASIPLALSDAMAAGRLPAGSTVLVTAFGSGLTWGAALLQF